MTPREARQTVWFVGWMALWTLGQPYHAYGGPMRTRCGLRTAHRHVDGARRSIAEMIGRPCKRCYP